ncbi:MAG TPA: transketolase C-terminal domain-containing protein [Candidatus Omnitrophota bacterium]|nr:transketolase C-terminal domain-containing protein [Candidatus Omnitrophota bacterium]
MPTIEGKGDFELGKGYILKEGSDVAIIACGVMVQEALLAYEQLKKEKISAKIINIHTIKPIDESIIIDAARSTKGIVVCEEHSIIGGLGSAVSEVLSEKHPSKVIRIGVRNRFGQSGDEKELMKEYGLTYQDIVLAAKSLQ